MRLAIDLAEQAAAEGRAPEGLKDAVIQALMVAGAALISSPELTQSESRPVNAYSGTIASFVAKSAEKAAESALADGRDSLLAAMEAWKFAIDAASSAEEERIVEELAEDFRKLHSAATQ